ncbi:catechol 1,2-dioxygenase [Starkeya sp. ORNL1]|uniref:dioxygenase family protein n=1 Tax=Starkeya sp. ORNL1 TaxID=2709380 RepID=UPI001463887D|nr:dioxygenase [Starkeya sp. ORNL1]QJP13462.1 catechol 1,2-dioxygenase [Starkeya sp. ORNL1]
MTVERTRLILEDLEQTLLQFMRKHKITHDEYRRATDILISTVKAGEESLLYDVFFEAEATDIGNIGTQGSIEAIEGPFYLPDAPRLERPYVLPQRSEEVGDVLFFRGRVTSTDGRPLAGAELDMWQADAEGLYSNIHPGLPAWNLRGRFHTAADGTFEVRTIVPPPYEIPKNGPTGVVLDILGRLFFRPAHLHVKVRHPQYGDLTSQLYFDGGEYLNSDVASAVRDDLVAQLIRCDNPKDLASRGLHKPYFEVRYDFVLVPQQAENLRRTA